MHIRKLVKAGAASHTVSLPKEWLEKNQLSKGDVVYIIEQADNSLRVTTDFKEKARPKKEITILTNNKDISCIQREITSAYLNNYSQITISGRDLSKKADDIRQVLHDFVALEVAEQTSAHIIAKDMLNSSEVSVDKTIRRMDMILRSMLIDAISDDKSVRETLKHRDDDMNRLYFLLFRLLKSSLADDTAAAAFNLKRSQILGKWYIILNMENMADYAKKIHELAEGLNKKEFKEFSELFRQINDNYLDVMKAYFNTDKDLANEVARRRIETNEGFTAWAQEKSSASRVALVETLKSLSTHVTNISRLIIDEDET